MMRRLSATVVCAGLAVAMSGCQHKTTLLAPLPPVLIPVDLISIPPMKNLPMLETPVARLPPVPIAAAASRPRRERKKPVAAKAPTEPVATPATPVAEPSSEDAAIGALTAGNEANPRMRQEAADMIGSIEQRLNGLSAQKAEEQKAQISKVRNFQRQAREALASGDAEGAKTLAMKGKLLLDDLEK
jgi:hypothetical protein